MFDVIHIESSKVFKVYDIVYNNNNYPKFLIRSENEWKLMSAKYFKPVEEKRLRG